MRRYAFVESRNPYTLHYVAKIMGTVVVLSIPHRGTSSRDSLVTSLDVPQTMCWIGVPRLTAKYRRYAGPNSTAHAEMFAKCCVAPQTSHYCCTGFRISLFLKPSGFEAVVKLLPAVRMFQRKHNPNCSVVSQFIIRFFPFLFQSSNPRFCFSRQILASNGHIKEGLCGDTEFIIHVCFTPKSVDWHRTILFTMPYFLYVNIIRKD